MYFISETHYSVSEQWIVTTVYVFYFRDSLQCIRTMDCDYSLCSMFAPGDRHIILGSKVSWFKIIIVNIRFISSFH